MATRRCGPIQLFSKEYFTKNATPRNRARPPTQAKSFTPRKFSQFIAGTGGLGGAVSKIGSGTGAAPMGGGTWTCGGCAGNSRGKGQPGSGGGAGLETSGVREGLHGL